MGDSKQQPTNASGVKLPYFHRTLSDEEKKLIGDISPKRIDQSSSNINTNGTAKSTAETSSTTTSSSSSSAWNSGSTWEERNVSSWAIEFVQSNFCKAPSQSQELSVKSTGKSFKLLVKSIENVKGNAQITYSRGKARYLYELSFTINITVNDGASVYSGKIFVEDAINDMLDDLILSATWSIRPPPSLLTGLDKSLTRTDGEIANHIGARLKYFESEFRKLGGVMEQETSHENSNLAKRSIQKGKAVEVKKTEDQNNKAKINVKKQIEPLDPTLPLLLVGSAAIVFVSYYLISNWKIPNHYSSF